MKYGPDTISSEIAKIFNEMSESGQYPNEVGDATLVPIQKPGKKAGPSQNLRPIILLSMLRKILAICKLRRCLDKILLIILNTQAAYQQGRSTTELVFSMKVLAEKAITSDNYEIMLLLFDMSKAFDTVRRNELFKILKEVLDDDDLHMMKILVENVKLKVKIGNEIGNDIHTNIRIPQGDCLSPIFFIVYLAEALKPILHTNNVEGKRNSKDDHNIIINQQYADDISWITNMETVKENLKKEVPSILKEKNLQVNETKSEEYVIKRGEDESWKNCKYLGSLLETDKDINRRKILATNTYNQLKYIFENKKTSEKTKFRIFKSHVESIFTYNCELWTLTKKHEESIDIFQRKLMRRILNLNWQDKVSNDKLYKRTNSVPWSQIVKRRRLTWYGHLLRLPEDTSARKSLKEAKKPCKKPRGGQKLTWLRQIEKDLEKVEFNTVLKNRDGSFKTVRVKEHEKMAENRHIWRLIVDRAMSL